MGTQARTTLSIGDHLKGRNTRLAVVAVIIVLSAAAGLLLRKVTFDFNPQAIFESDSEGYAYMREHDRIFGRDDNIVILLIDGRPADDPLVLDYVSRLAKSAAAVEGVIRVDGLNSAQLLSEQDGALAARPVMPQGVPNDESPQLVRQAARDPLLGGVLVAHDLSVCALFAVLSPKLYDLTQLEPVVEGLERVTAEVVAPVGVQARLAGIPFVRVDAVRDLIRDQSLFLPLTALVYIILLIFIFRWFWGVVLPVIAVAVSILWSMSAIVATGQPINIVNNVLPTLLFVIGISDSIHLLSRYREELALGHNRDEALAAMFKHLVLACFLTSVTTAVGVGSLVVAQTPMLRNFGLIAALGVMLAYVSTMTVIPSVLGLVAAPKVVQKKPGAGDRIDRMLASAAIYIVNRPRRFVVGAVVLTAFLGVISLGLKVDSYLLAVYTDSHPNQKTNQLVQRAFGGVIPMDIVFHSRDKLDLQRDSDLMRRMAEVQRFLESQPGVGRTVSMVDLLAAIYRAVSAEKVDREDPRALPLNDETVAQLLLVSELSGPEISSQFTRFVADKGQRVRIQSRIADMGARNVNALVDRTQAELDKIFYGRDDIEIRFTGDGAVGSISITRFVSDLASSVFTAGLIIFATIGFLFRSARIGLLSILPSVTPLLATLAMMAAADIYLDLTSIIVFSMALGLAVDNSIHILARYREERLAGAGCKAAVVRAYRGSGRAVIIAAFLLLLGFLVLFTSSFLPTQRIGLLSGICILGALVGVLVLLPALLVLFDKNSKTPMQRKDSTGVKAV